MVSPLKPVVAISILLSAFNTDANCAERPNIVVIYVDDQGWTGTSVQMDPDIPESKSDFIQTPRLEQLASEGMRFSNAYAEPSCSPSRAAMQTGMSPAQLQMTDVSAASKYNNSWYGPRYNGEPLTPPIQPRNLPLDQDTIAEHLKGVAPEYVTAQFLKWHLSLDSHGDNFSDWYGYDYFRLTHSSSEYLPGEDPGQIFSTTDTAIDFMRDRVDADEPFYMQVSHFAPHTPWQARPATLEKYQNLPPGTNHKNPLYAAMTEDLDTGVGMLLDEIESLQIEDNTYVVYLSDNGGIAALGPGVNAPLYHSKGTVYEGGIRVPMIVSGPGIQSGSVSDVPVTIRDLFATVSDWAGNSEPLHSDLESASLVPILENGGELPAGMNSLSRGFAPNGEIFFHSPHYNQQPPGFTDRSPQSAVRDGDYKLVRMYGENGQPDKVFLYNLAQNITETEDPNSPLNLAEQFPAKTTELLSKLDKWLDDTDASMPYQVWDDIELRWDAATPGADANAWRSTINVDNFFRERWAAGLGQTGPTLVSADRHQPLLPTDAFHFDGTQGLTRHFFHVSDNALPDVYDADHSATFEFWLRTDNLSQEQLIFETGDSYAGLSLSLGDGDSDGDFDDLRVVVEGGVDGGESSLVVTSELDKFADPTKDFVHVAIVVSDEDSDRYLELYVNGALFGREDGTSGAGGRLSWDDWNPDLDWAGLGMAGGHGVGGSGTSGDKPFTNGNFRGEISLIRYFNTALQPAVIESHFNEVLHPADYGIHSFSGDVLIPDSRPADVSLNSYESNSMMVVHERNDVLDASLAVDALVFNPTDITPGSLPAGTEFTSYLFQFDPLSNDGGTEESVFGTIRFSQEIIAILLDPNSLAGSDPLLGSLGNYGLEADRGVALSGDDILAVSADLKTLLFDLDAWGDEQLQFRVLTEQVLEADFDRDGDVDGDDLALLETSYGLDDGADADFDGLSTGLDFLEWQRQTGSQIVVSNFIDSSVVPEPTSQFLFVFALLTFAFCTESRFARTHKRFRE